MFFKKGNCCGLLQNNDDDRKLEKRLEVIQGSDGSGIHRKLRLGPGLRTDRVRYVLKTIQTQHKD